VTAAEARSDIREQEHSLASVLLVEDDEALANMLLDRLRARGYQVWHATDARQAEAIAGETQPDLFILDLMLPDAHGLVLCANLRQQSTAPIIVCSATKRKDDATIALKLGAVDFLPKPFSVDEFEARIEVALRSASITAPASPPADETWALGPLRVERSRCRVLLWDQPLSVTPTEFRLLSVLVARPNTVVSRQELAAQVWGFYDHGIGNSLGVHVRRLRGKLKRAALPPPVLVAVRGFGYQLGWEPSAEVAAAAREPPA
jgi:DNA-binding response OmpR family regulator